jgi:hypothetical protein
VLNPDVAGQQGFQLSDLRPHDEVAVRKHLADASINFRLIELVLPL